MNICDNNLIAQTVVNKLPPYYVYPATKTKNLNISDNNLVNFIVFN